MGVWKRLEWGKSKDCSLSLSLRILLNAGSVQHLKISLSQHPLSPQWVDTDKHMHLQYQVESAANSPALGGLGNNSQGRSCLCWILKEELTSAQPEMRPYRREE